VVGVRPANCHLLAVVLSIVAIFLTVLRSAFGVHLVSSQGYFLRSHHQFGALPIDPAASAWEKATSVVIPLSGQVLTPPHFLLQA